MLPAAEGDEEKREEEMGLDLLLGLGLLPLTMAASGGHGGGSAAQQRRRHPYGKTGFHDEPLSFAAATETASATMRACVRRLSADVDDDGDDVVPAAPPASMLKPASSTAWWPAHATSSPKGARRGHAFVTGCRRTDRRSTEDSTAPMTVIYAGSVRAYAGVTMEHAEKILAMVAKEAHAAGTGILPVQQAEPQLELVAAPAPTGGAAQMTMHWGLAYHVNDCLKRTASLARFLDKRKQRAETSAAATILHHPPRREEWFPAQIMDDAPAATVSARTSASLGGMDRRPRASQDHLKRMKANHAEEAEAVSTELKI